MMKKLKCIMLIDDNPNDNFFHERVIKKCSAAEVVVVKQSGKAALECLSAAEGSDDKLCPELIFLDVNMPGMNGWEFLREYERLGAGSKSRAMVVILTTSENPDDEAKATGMNAGFKSKPLTPEALEDVIGRLPAI